MKGSIENGCFKVLKMVYMQPKWISGSLCLFIMAFLLPHRVGANDVTYKELIELKAACGDLDSCQGYRTTDDLRVVNCQCGPICAELGTCCVDSKYRTVGMDAVKSRFEPSRPYRSKSVVFMVNDCKPDWGDKGIKDRCEIPLHQAFYEDKFLLLPVTILRTGITYKNYYCYACNEDRSFDSSVVWNFRLLTNRNFSAGANPNPTERFFPDIEIDGLRFYSIVGAPEKLHPYLNWYRQSVTSTCDEEWTDVTIKEKCAAYTALVYYYEQYKSPLYKNPHCAICNYRNVSNLRCSEPTGNIILGGIPIGFHVSVIYPLEDRAQRCAENEVFDNLQKKCRAIRCGPNQQLVEDSKCKQGDLCSWFCESSSETTKSPGTELPVQEDNIEDLTLSPSFSTATATPEMPETPSPTQNPVISPRPRPGYPKGFRIPIPSTGKIPPRPPYTTSYRYNFSHFRIIHNYTWKSHSVRWSYFISTE